MRVKAWAIISTSDKKIVRKDRDEKGHMEIFTEEPMTPYTFSKQEVIPVEIVSVKKKKKEAQK